MTTSSSLRPGAVERLARIDATLESTYGTPEVELGNKRDPLEEAIYIILSFQTELTRLMSTWSDLRAAYPSWRALEHADASSVARVLRHGGLHRQKSKTIRRLLAGVRGVSGEYSLELLRAMTDDEAERLLTRLPGLSWKGARCVLLYSLGRDVLPIDSNSFRILKRTGVLKQQAVYRRRTLHDGIQAAVPAHRRRSLHVNLVVHGQRTCLPRAPRCVVCALSSECPKAGVPRPRTRRLRTSRSSSKKSRSAVVAKPDGFL
jgi:endonuclease-3